MKVINLLNSLEFDYKLQISCNCVYFPQNCKYRDNKAVCTCFSIECASFNGNKPIRYCQICHEARHNTVKGKKHVYHLSIPIIWDCSLEVQRYLMDAIIRWVTILIGL